MVGTEMFWCWDSVLSWVARPVALVIQSYVSPRGVGYSVVCQTDSQPFDIEVSKCHCCYGSFVVQDFVCLLCLMTCKNRFYLVTTKVVVSVSKRGTFFESQSFVFLITFLLRSVVCPMMSCRFLFLLYPYTWWLLNTVLRFLLFCQGAVCGKWSLMRFHQFVL